MQWPVLKSVWRFIYGGLFLLFIATQLAAMNLERPYFQTNPKQPDATHVIEIVARGSAAVFLTEDEYRPIRRVYYAGAFLVFLAFLMFVVDGYRGYRGRAEN